MGADAAAAVAAQLQGLTIDGAQGGPHIKAAPVAGMDTVLAALRELIGTIARSTRYDVRLGDVYNQAMKTYIGEECILLCDFANEIACCTRRGSAQRNIKWPALIGGLQMPCVLSAEGGAYVRCRLADTVGGRGRGPGGHVASWPAAAWPARHRQDGGSAGTPSRRSAAFPCQVTL